MKYVSIIILLLSSFFLTAQTVIPAPETVVQGNGEFRTKNLQADIRQTTNTALPSEAYRLQVTENGIEIEASGDAGFFYARQTLKQLASDQNGTWIIPCLKIEDRPRVGFRSFLLDSGRQYQKVSTIKKYIDMAALLKMNYFHWHLTEGLGWRIEIKQYPRLTEVGAFVGKGPEQQGFYSQEEIKEIVRYAAERGITVIPEIDMPGHAEAALVAYPELGCFGDTIQVPENGFTQNIFCAGKTHTLDFLKNVLDEVCELFPSEYIHLGGDEAPKGNWGYMSRLRAMYQRTRFERQPRSSALVLSTDGQLSEKQRKKSNLLGRCRLSGWLCVT